MKVPKSLLPFRVERQAGDTLTDQVEQGLRHAILNGFYPAGASLPSYLTMAEELGVSEIIVRRAIAKLKAGGLVVARPRSGVEVCDPGNHAWAGHLLYAHWSGPNMYYHNILREEIVARLQARRYLVTDLTLTDSEKDRGFATLRSYLATRAVTMALVQGGMPGKCERMLQEYEVPFVQLGTLRPLPTARTVIQYHLEDVLREVVLHCQTCGIRSVLIVARSAEKHPLHALLVRAGIRVSVLIARPARGMESPEAVEVGGLRAMMRWLSVSKRYPDLVYFSDDIMARGALSAIQEAGLRVPEDLQVITWANRGNGPVTSKPLTRIENLPRQHGAAVAEILIATLHGEGPAGPSRLEPQFVVGETTRNHHG
jgi:DNA-binding LacI/PurR family transcriptional regulator